MSKTNSTSINDGKNPSTMNNSSQSTSTNKRP